MLILTTNKIDITEIRAYINTFDGFKRYNNLGDNLIYPFITERENYILAEDFFTDNVNINNRNIFITENEQDAINGWLTLIRNDNDNTNEPNLNW